MTHYRNGIILFTVVLSIIAFTTFTHADPLALGKPVKPPKGVNKNYAPVAQTGQTVSFAPGDDGALQKGIAWPIPRFTDHGNGTFTDNLTGLIWLKQMDCLGQETWNNALASCNSLADGQCGLTDGSVQGDWRLPNVREFTSLVDYGKVDPALPSGYPFQGYIPFVSAWWWTSTTNASSDFTYVSWAIELFRGSLAYGAGKTDSFYVMCVR